VERRQFKRKSLGGGHRLRVSLFLNSHSLVYSGRSEEFEIEASAFNISSGGIGIKLEFKADFISLLPERDVMVRLSSNGKDLMLPARVAHFESEQKTLGLEFKEPLADLGAVGL